MTTPTTPTTPAPLTFAAPATPLSLLAPGLASHPHAATLLRAAAVCAAPVDPRRPLDAAVRADNAVAFGDAMRAASDAILRVPFADPTDFAAWEDIAHTVGLSPFRDMSASPRAIVGRLAGTALALLALADEQEADVIGGVSHATTTRVLALTLTQIAESVRFAVAPADDPVAAHVEAQIAYAMTPEPVTPPAPVVPTVLPRDMRVRLRATLRELEQAETVLTNDVQRAMSNASEPYARETEEAQSSFDDALSEVEQARDVALAWVREQLAAHDVDDHEHPLMQLAARLTNIEVEAPEIADLKYDNSEADEGVQFNHDVPAPDTFDADDDEPADDASDFSVNG